MNQINRLAGGLIDRAKAVKFTFDGKEYSGFAGDTLASALLANGVQLVGRSFKYHRPRGVFTSGSEEPNALVELREGARKEPNTRATTIELYDGLVASSQNRWPSLGHDFLAVNDLLSPFLTAGFYYKTFMWPKAFWEKLYEPMIRRAAGLGSLSLEDDPDHYDKGFIHCDILVIGAGPAGLAAALQAGRAGARVILADEDHLAGGRLNTETHLIGDERGNEWAARVVAELRSMSNVRVLTRTTVYGAYDHGIYGAVERLADHLPVPKTGTARQILWRIYSRRAILCAGALERPIAFPNNDRPGVMLAGAVRAYANRFAVASGRTVAIFTNNDDGHRTASDLLTKGINVAAVIDSRKDAPNFADYKLIAGAQVVNTHGRKGVNAITVRTASGAEREINCGCLAVSGGWNPNVALTCHQRGRPVWNESLAAFVAGESMPVGMSIAGAAQGSFSTAAALQTGAARAIEALEAIGLKATKIDLPKAEDDKVNISPLWQISSTKGRSFIDLQNDVTTKDVKIAFQENFRSVEHLKRYTTLGMATDQGKTSNMGGLAAMAELTGQSIADTGTTIFRPPYTPVALGALAGRAVGRSFMPTRHAPSNAWAREQGASFVEAGMWERAQWFAQPGETDWRQSVDREVLATRGSVGVCDVSTLGKIDVQGRDAAQYLDFVYCNTMSTLGVGKVRYGLMLREDGFVMDDGTAARMADDHYVVTTTTANAGPVYRHMEFVRQCLKPDLDVQLISITDAWAQFAVAGPNSRKVLQKVVDPQFDLANDAFPYMACGDISVCGGLRARLFRISFSGELAYEIAVPARYGDGLIRAIMAAGKEFDIVPYGLEALGVMRIEKGHMTGNELNGQTTALNLGFGKMVSTKKDCIGAVSARREGLNPKDPLKLVGLKPVKAGERVVAGAHLIAAGQEQVAANDEGWITSACYSPNVQSYIGLGFLKNGSERMGETVVAASPLTGSSVEMMVVSSYFVDPEGERLRG